jgi:uncharacterized protein (DUF433 family)
MSTQARYPHITIDADGTSRIGKTRYKVLHLAAEHYHHGWTAEELLRQHPDLRPEEIYSALAYFYDHRAGLVEEMKGSLEAAAAARTTTISRQELLRRQEARRG